MPLFEEEINQVDFAAFLVGRGVTLEERGDTDGIVVGPEKGLHHLLSSVVPPSEGHAVGICVGEEDDFVVAEGEELVDLEFVHASGSEPGVLGIEL